MSEPVSYFSMFSGIGGFEFGIQRAIPSARCVGYSEIDKYAISVYERHYNGHTNFGNATDINLGELGRFDLLVGGFPCQAFSVAGKRQGFEDTRGTLFFDVARILKHKRPRHLVLENVKGLLSHDGGQTFQTILGVLSDLGYFVEWQVLNSKDFGVPQNRERIYIVGHLGSQPGRKVFPIGAGGKPVDELSGHHATTITSRYGGSQAVGTYVIERELDAQDDCTNRQDREQAWHRPNADLKHGGAKATPRIRRLTPVECERLQGFPDNWTSRNAADQPVSDTQRYKMCGNAVTTNVVQALMERLAPCMKECK